MYRFLFQNAVAIVFLLLVAAFAAASLYGSSLLPPASYEPLGSAAFPKSLGLITLCLLILQVISLIRNHRNRPEPTDPNAADRSDSQSSVHASVPASAWTTYHKPALMLCVMIVYLATMSYGGLDFRISTSAFLCLATCLLARPDNPKKVFLIAMCSIAFAVVLDLVFKHLFYIDI